MLLTLAEIADQLGRSDEEAVRRQVGGKALGLAALLPPACTFTRTSR